MNVYSFPPKYVSFFVFFWVAYINIQFPIGVTVEVATRHEKDKYEFDATCSISDIVNRVRSSLEVEDINWKLKDEDVLVSMVICQYLIGVCLLSNFHWMHTKYVSIVAVLSTF